MVFHPRIGNTTNGRVQTHIHNSVCRVQTRIHNKQKMRKDGTWSFAIVPYMTNLATNYTSMAAFHLCNLCSKVLTSDQLPEHHPCLIPIACIRFLPPKPSPAPWSTPPTPCREKCHHNNEDKLATWQHNAQPDARQLPCKAATERGTQGSIFKLRVMLARTPFEH